MRVRCCILGLVASMVYAYPEMGSLMNELMTRAADRSTKVMPLPGDLRQGATSQVGKTVKDCLEGKPVCESTAKKTYEPPGTLTSKACAKDTCCVWHYVAEDLISRFTEKNGECNALARAAVRFGFHDAASWDMSMKYGGADGSLFLDPTEINRDQNAGLAKFRAVGLDLLKKYPSIGAADLAQFGHNVAVVSCPLGTRTLTLIGRPSSKKANNHELLPDAKAPADKLIELFENKTTNAADLAALLGAHTTGTQSFFDRTKAGQPFDSTPGIWDVNYHSEILSGDAPKGVFRLPSDTVLGGASAMKPHYILSADPKTGQTHWNQMYSQAYVRMSLYGVKSINSLTDCTAVLPSQQDLPASPAPTQHDHRHSHM